MSFPRLVNPPDSVTAAIKVERTDTFDIWRQKCNQMAVDLGNIDLLEYPCNGSESVVEAINKILAYVLEVGRAYWIRSIAMN